MKAREAACVGLLAVLAASAGLVVWRAPMPLGLDFEGGAHLVYTMPFDDDPQNEGAYFAARYAAHVVDERLARVGVDGFAAGRVGAVEVFVHGDDAADVAAARSALARPGRLEVLTVEPEAPADEPALAACAPEVTVGRTALGSGVDVFGIARGSGAADALTACFARLPQRDGRTRLVGPWTEGGADAMRSYLVVQGNRVGQSHVSDAVASDDGGMPTVTVAYDAEGRDELAQVTREQVGKQLAIVLDDVVLMAPVVTGPITAGRARIALGHGGTQEEAVALAGQLRAGALPATLTLASVSVVAPAFSRRTVWLGVALVAVLLVALAVVAAVRWRVGALAVLPGAPLVLLVAASAAAMLHATLTSTLTLGWVAALVPYFAASAALLERGRRGASVGRAAAWVAGAHVAWLVACGVADAVAHGPWRGFTLGLLSGVPASALVTLLLATVLAAHSMRPTTSTKL